MPSRREPARSPASARSSEWARSPESYERRRLDRGSRRRGCGIGRDGSGERLGRSHARTERQHGRRIEVAVLIVRSADAEVDVRLADAGLVARADRPDAVALDDRRALGHGEGAEMGQRHRPAVRGLDRDAPAVPRHRAHERHHPRGRRAHQRSEGAGDVDAAVEPGALGGSRSKENACTTGPSVGHVHAPAGAATASVSISTSSNRRMSHHLIWSSSDRCRARSASGFDLSGCVERDGQAAVGRLRAGSAGRTSVRHGTSGGAGCQCRRRSCHRVVTKIRGRGRFGTRPSGAQRPLPPRGAAFRPRPGPRPPPAPRPSPPKSRRRQQAPRPP